MIEIFFGNTKDKTECFDSNGIKIKKGDILTYDYTDNNKIKDWMKEPCYIVKYEEGFFAEGINQKLFLHSFRFKYTEIIQNK